jgi:CRISPR type I-E-associated protein CasB/Cse2
MSTELQPEQNQPDLNKQLAAVVGTLAFEIDTVFSPGDRAELRRLQPSDPLNPAFLRLWVRHIEPTDGAIGPLEEDRWAALLTTFARLEGLHSPTDRLGRALAEADVSELRVLRLLRSHGGTLWDATRQIAHQLASQRQRCSWIDLARLLLSDGRRDEARVRRSIAKDYYRQIGATDAAAASTLPEPEA